MAGPKGHILYMEPDHLTQLIIDYRYWIVIPLSFLEGPVIAFVVGTLSAFGYFNPFVAVWVFFAKDMIMDVVFYLLGRYAKSTAYVHRLLHKGGIITESTEEFRKQWHTHAFRTMFMAKLPHGFSSVFLAMAGVIEAPWKQFISYAAIVAVLQYVLLFVFGYYFGAWLGLSSDTITRIQYVVTAFFVVSMLYLAVVWYVRRRIKKKGGL